MKPSSKAIDGAVVAYLCNFLEENDAKPWKVLKAASLDPKTDADWHNQRLMRSTRYTRLFSVTCLKHFILIVRLPLTPMILTRSLLSRILTLMLIRFKFFSYMSFVGSVQGLFSCFSFSLRSLPVSHMEGSSLHNLSSLPGLAFFFVIS